MECDRVAAWLPLLPDRALPIWRRLRLARHVAGCPACAARVEELQHIRNAMRTQLPYHRAPPGLATRIVASLPRDALPEPARPWFRLPALAFAGTGLGGALAGAALVLLVLGGPPGNLGEPVITAVIDDHVSSMMANHLTDVLTSDQHTVKPWLSAHVDVSPPVHELAPEGFPLVGGRVAYIDGHQAAVVVYRHAKHVINLFAWASPSRPDAPFQATSSQGFNVITWRAAGITYFAVSDLEADQLAEFARLAAAK
jgi:anti-sigma factor RsiW